MCTLGTYLPSYLLNTWSRVILEKLTCFHLVKNFPTFYGTRRFITAFTSARHLSLSWASSIQSVLPHSTSWWSILTPNDAGVSQMVSFPQVSPTKPCICLSSTHTRYMPRPSHSSRFYHRNNSGWGVQTMKLLIMNTLGKETVIHGWFHTETDNSWDGLW